VVKSKSTHGTQREILSFAGLPWAMNFNRFGLRALLSGRNLRPLETNNLALQDQAWFPLLPGSLPVFDGH